MAQIGKTRTITDSEGGSWQIYGTIDTDSGAKTLILYGSSGQILQQGSANDIINLVKQLPSAGPEDFFVQDVISAAREMEVSLANSVPPPVQDTAATAINNAPDGTSTAGEVSESEQQRLSDANSTSDSTVENTRPKSESDNTEKLEFKDINVEGARVRENPLHAYPSYTYSLSLHLLSVQEFNTMVETQEYQPSNVLISSAGRYNNVKGTGAFNRNIWFNDDFYFEDLTMTTVIGVGETNRSTNAVDIKFTIIEPYGLTLLDRIVDASRQLGIDNYLQNPYMLQIDFYGCDDDGNIISPIPNITKNIPIQIRTCTASVTTKGSEYNITASPFSHQAFDQRVQECPINVEVAARTVEGFFKSTSEGAQELATRIAKDREEREEYRRYRQDVQERATMNNQVLPLTSVSERLSRDPIYSTTSLADAINAYYISLENNLSLVSDRINFVFHPDIAKATIVDAMPAPSDRPMNATDLIKAIRGNAGVNVGAFNENEVKTPVSYGSSIEAIIARTIRNSSYIRDQLAVLEGEKDVEKYNLLKEKNKTADLEWFKIIPVLKLRGYDPFTNMFGREITYYVVPYTIKNIRLDDAPKGKATRNDAVKFYNYIYTGSNSDILDLKIDFNAVYYTSITAFRSNYLNTSGISDYFDTGTSCEVAKLPPPGTTLQPTQRFYKLPDQRDITSVRSKTAAEIAAADLERSIMTEPTADMMKVDLSILGDPEFIKQDDLFYPPTLDENGNPVRVFDTPITKNGSIKTDQGEVYVLLIIKTPTDINDETGMMSFGERAFTSGFSGLYRVHVVENEFNKGSFKQKLTLVRQPEQDGHEDSMQSALERAKDWKEYPTGSGDIATPAENKEEDAVAVDDTTTQPAAEPATAVEPAPEDNQKDLAAVRDTAPEVPISNQTEPQTTTPQQIPVSETVPNTARSELESQIEAYEKTIIPRQQRRAAAQTSAENIEFGNAEVAKSQAKLAELKAQLAATP